ncbi:MAG TPA: D-alanyl-D-alanine endopeptidase [Burkholderiales bacterium]|nr:D-alanyl-D-alanine endopeptidase [Burkholderiales bacterium]
MSDPVVVTGLPVLEPLPAPLELRVDPAQRQRLTISDSGDAAGPEDLALRSAAALVISQDDGQLLYAKNTDAVMPIASITKLMTAMVILDSGLSLDEPVTITRHDVDRLKGTKSRLQLGLTLPRREMLRLALMASENRAAAALARSHPGGTEAFVQAMNLKARQLGMRDTRFVDASGLNPNNVSTALDLAVLVNAGYHYPLIRDYSTTDSVRLAFRGSRKTRAMAFRNSNSLVRSAQWEIGLQKTGYISEAGRCLVMQARISARPVIIVLLDSWGKFTRVGDANRIKRWVETLDIPAAHKPRLM